MNEHCMCPSSGQGVRGTRTHSPFRHGCCLSLLSPLRLLTAAAATVPVVMMEEKGGGTCVRRCMCGAAEVFFWGSWCVGGACVVRCSVACGEMTMRSIRSSRSSRAPNTQSIEAHARTGRPDQIDAKIDLFARSTRLAEFSLFRCISSCILLAER